MPLTTTGQSVKHSLLCLCCLSTSVLVVSQRGVGEGGNVPVVIGEFLARLDVCTGEEDEAALPLYLNHLGVHAGRTTVILRHPTHHVSTDKASANSS